MQTYTDLTARTPADNPDRPGCSEGEDAALFLAGRMAPAGAYRLAGTDREVMLEQDDVLPATLDGRIAVYERRPPTWGELQGQTKRA
jgi:hypothetical protein